MYSRNDTVTTVTESDTNVDNMYESADTNVYSVYLKSSDLSFHPSESMTIFLCSTINTFFPDEAIGAQKLGRTWRIWIKSSTTRDDLLTQGLNINGHTIRLFVNNPFLNSSRSIRSEKIFFKDLNFDVDENLILDYINNNFKQLNVKSDLMRAKVKYQSETWSPFYNGDRYIYVDAGFLPPLPKSFEIENQTYRIWHSSQSQICKRCNSRNHKTASTDRCPAYEISDDIVAFQSRYNILCNFYKNNLKFDGMTFTSVEQAYQFKKCKYLEEDDLASKILKTDSPDEAKEIASHVKHDEKWHEASVDTMKQILEARANQCTDFVSALLESGDKLIVEATTDTFWACGLGPNLAKTTKPSFHPGHNMLGGLLMDLRSKLKKGTITSDTLSFESKDLEESNSPSTKKTTKEKPVVDQGDCTVQSANQDTSNSRIGKIPDNENVSKNKSEVKIPKKYKKKTMLPVSTKPGISHFFSPKRAEKRKEISPITDKAIISSEKSSKQDIT